jgi:hypothetical protein
MKAKAPRKPGKKEASKEKLKKRTRIVRSELNLEQNPVFTVSNYRGKSREIITKRRLPSGEVNESKIIVGKTVDGFEVGVLTTNHFRIYLALIKLWEEAGRPINEPVHFTTLKILKAIGLSDTGPNYETVKRTLRNLVQIPITFENAFFVPVQDSEKGGYESLEDFHILSELYIYERKKVGKKKKTRGYGEFQFSSPIIKSLVNNYSHPLRLDVIRSFKKHRDLAILLYTYIDRSLAFRDQYEILLINLFDLLDLSQRHVKYPSGRKRVIEPALEQLEGKDLSTGILSYCRVHKTADGKDYKLICRRAPFTGRLDKQDSPAQLEWLGLEFGQSQDIPKSKDPKSGLLSVLMEKGLTQKQAARLVSEVGAEDIITQVDCLPFRVHEYKAQGREINEAAILYDSIKDKWNPPEGYVKAEKEKEKEAEIGKLREEYKERIREARVKAAKWAARSPEDRVAAPLESWIWGEEHFNNHKPTEEEIEARKAELISYLQTQEEYELLLIDEIEREIRDKEQMIRES